MPAGMRVLGEAERQEMLDALSKSKHDIEAQLLGMPFVLETPSLVCVERIHYAGRVPACRLGCAAQPTCTTVPSARCPVLCCTTAAASDRCEDNLGKCCMTPRHPLDAGAPQEEAGGAAR